ncbi:signal peptidase I [Nocardioides alpinus]|uniref:Signal peptidase I n=1 Tax=Nocardioides alpinus TaxID=748909 RepID=A0A1I0XFM4_9ACTN|nr:signal peptidase I [Nocardioides alpinus]PKH44296.1 signal peptidase I [Nocardioides alpinus]SFA99236.1 signal peptidase I [Nocardioides alpinus]
MTAVRTWAHLVGVLAARMYRAFLLGLVVIAVAPVLFGWGSYVIESGSMEPSIQVGDVVSAKPYTPDQPIGVGRVFVFDDPAPDQDRLVVHRVVELRDDGDYTSAGDANEVTDITPLPRDHVRGTAVLLAPYAGLPVTWVQSGKWAHLTLWLLITVAAFAMAVRNIEGEPPTHGPMRAVRGWFARSTPTVDVPGRAARSRVPLLAVAGLVLLSTLASTASAGFTGQTRNSGWSFTASRWAQPYVNAVLADAPQILWLLDEKTGATTAQDKSGNQYLGTYKSTTVLGQPGGLLNNPGTSISTTGALALTGAYAAGSATTHTVELWFRSADQTGGYLSGFGLSTTAGTPSYEDRVVRLTSGGRITYGDWSNTPKSVITTPSAYDDNLWHQLVVVSTAASNGRQNTVIYVDGVARVSGLTSRVESYTGYVRVGGGSGTAAFNGSIDNVSFYGTALSAQRVAAHYAAR